MENKVIIPERVHQSIIDGKGSFWLHYLNLSAFPNVPSVSEIREAISQKSMKIVS